LLKQRNSKEPAFAGMFLGVGMQRFSVLLALLWAIVAAPVDAQPPQWSKSDVEELLSLVLQVGSEGLDPSDYDHAGLRPAAVASGNPERVSQSATQVFLQLAADFSHGHVPDPARVGWYIKAPLLSDVYKRTLLDFALSQHRVEQTLRGLLPATPEYQMLRKALAETPPEDKASIQRLRANLERWRWMPRDLGSRYVLVNVPAFELMLIDGGKVTARHKIIVGKTNSPTPQFGAIVEAVQFNPSWYVPKSIIAESVGKLVRTHPELARQRGFIASAGGIRQRPGPENALGQMKLVMPNKHTVYIHDTPAKTLFDEEVRTFSHGCIRTHDALGLAAELLAGPNWDRLAIDPLIQSTTTTIVRLDAPIPVYVAYFTAAPDQAGQITTYPDVYARDRPVVVSLTDRQRPDPTVR
jgi:murein L,D-transpeptidase YcbB/YkuD